MHQSQKAFFALPLHLLGHTSASHGCFSVDLVRCASALEISSSLRGQVPRLLPFSQRVDCLAPEVPLMGECRRGQRYFWQCRIRMDNGSVTGPTLKKALCHPCPVVGWRTNTESFFRFTFLFVGHTSAGCGCFGVDLTGCALALEISSGLRGPSPQAFTTFGGGV